MHTYETLKALTVEELKAMCKELKLRNYSDLREDELIEKLLSSGKLEAEEQTKETNLIDFEVLRPVKTSTLGDVKQDFSITKEQYEKDLKLKKAIKFGFVKEL